MSDVEQQGERSVGNPHAFVTWKAWRRASLYTDGVPDGGRQGGRDR